MNGGDSYLVGIHQEDWMDMVVDELGMDVIFPPRVTNIPRSTTILTVNAEEEDEPRLLEAMRLDRVVKAQPVASTPWPSEPTYLLPSNVNSSITDLDLVCICTVFTIPS